MPVVRTGRQRLNTDMDVALPANRSLTLPILEHAASERLEYRCPGEDYPISPSLHLARLASFYPACRACEYREETAHLASAQLRSLGELERHGLVRLQPSEEAFEGVYLNELGAAEVRQIAQALALCLWRDHRGPLGPPRVVVASDGRWLSAPLVSAACQQLRLGLCDVLEAEPSTAAALARAMVHFEADGGLLIGNPAGESHAVGVKLWGSRGVCWSRGGGLRQAVELLGQADRAGRGYGSLKRVRGADIYLEQFKGCFHGLRPLGVVLDTACLPLLRYLEQLAAGSACSFIPPEIIDTQAFGSSTRRPPRSGRPQADDRESFVAHRLALIETQVRRSEAHFGVWIDGDGERSLFVDELGQQISWEKVLYTMDAHIPGERAIVCDQAVVSGPLAQIKSRLHSATSTRQAMVEAMQHHSATLGGDSLGRFYFGSNPPAADALQALLIMLALLSQSDKPASAAIGPK